MADDFNTGEPIAYLLTWTTYGTWLPGDNRGWNRKGEIENQPPNPLFEEIAGSRLNEEVFLLSSSDRKIVEETIRAHCDIRNWELYAVNVRSNHVHVVVGVNGYKPEDVARQFKAWCTRKLKLNHGLREKFWTQGGSCRWINGDEGLARAIEYTLDAQDRKGVELD